ncbi:hypothetical protein [Cnuibacter physcomitrellae]|nr:hypothetical protein [Cnuibacter physcomitrellae]
MGEEIVGEEIVGEEIVGEEIVGEDESRVTTRRQPPSSPVIDFPQVA